MFASKAVTASEVDGIFPELEIRPGWRILILCQETTNTMEINFTWNHPHADGISGKIFQEDLCQSLNTQTLQDEKTQQNGDSFVVELPQVPQLPPPIEELCKLPLSLNFIAKMAWAEFGPASLAWTRPCLANWAPFQLSPYKTQFRAFVVEKDSLSNILSACGQHKTTLTGLLHGLTLVSIASRLDQETAPAFESGTTVDMRRFLPSNPPAYPWLQPTKTMGNYVTIMSPQFDSPLVSQIRSHMSPADKTLPLPVELIQQVWSISARVRGEIKRKLDMGLKNDPVGAMRLVKDWRQQMSDTAKRPRQFSWWVTGVGVLEHRSELDKMTTSMPDNSLPEDSWVVNRAQFAFSTETTAAAFNISPMTAAGNRLTVGVSWQDCICDVEMAEHVMRDLQQWLGQIAGL
jgi:hypothetical protein